MTTFFEHLELLVGSAGPRDDTATSLVDQWSSVKAPLQNDDSGMPDLDADVPWPSLTDLSDLPTYSPSALSVADDLVRRLLSIPYMDAVIPGILATLSSNGSVDSIFEDLAEILGLDELDLVSELLQHRLEVAQKLEAYSQKPTSSAEVENRQHSQQQRLNGETNSAATSQLSLSAARRRQEETLRANAARPLFSSTAPPEAEVLPHVYTSSAISQGNTLSHLGSKYLLPVNTTREYHEDYEEVTIPPAKPVPPRRTERLIAISQLNDIAKGSFPGYTSLNRIQSIVYPIAYQTNENLLICAPTGAGKTDVAMLTILRVLDQHRDTPATRVPIASTIRRDDIKIIYVAPMKALASEIVRKLGSRLKWLSIRVRELTGDMQLTRAEIAETQIIVTTPEKWDVVTRKPTGEGELASKVKLLIIDEVHLLNEERGAVIETIVARTLRQVESTQSLIRIVGLSATLPNYVDVADFLRVSRYQGLFYFDSSFRPIPLEQHLIGIKGKTGSAQSRRNMDRVTYEKVSALVNEGHQVMVFVHARKETVKTALALKDTALTEGLMDEFSCQEDPAFARFRMEISTSRNKELKQLFDYGFGIHHAGMLRSDRNLVERAFQARLIKVLCCTATLAWGVNLPAHAVLIKGTQVYDSGRGKFVDLSVLDVLQIFGRAGRPGLETSGEGYILSTEDKLNHYLEKVTAQNPIESQFVAGMIDSLNAEIALGTVANIAEAVQWIGYTYLFVRMRKNPFVYGMAHDELTNDPTLSQKRRELAESKAKSLAEARMITFNERLGTLAITDLGRIAAKYYIRTASIEIYNKELRPKMSEADVLRVLSMSTEFDQIQLRENEVEELRGFIDNKDIVPCQVHVNKAGDVDANQGKVNVLLQAHISYRYPEDFALVSDMAYVAQNGGRIIRALLEIALSRKWASTSAVLMALSKAIEKRIWSFEHPLVQFKNELRQELVYNLTNWADDFSVAELASKSAADLGTLLHMNEKHGAALLKVARQFAAVVMTYEMRPITSDLLRIVIHIKRAFDWGSRPSNSIEPFWLWVEDHKGLNILQLSHILFRNTTESLDCDFVIRFSDHQSLPWVTLRYVSDRWLGSEDEIHIPLENVLMPPTALEFTPVLQVPFLSLSTLDDPAIEDAFASNFHNFNAIQTQSLWNLINSRQNSILCAPSGSGKSTLGQMLLLKTLRSDQSNGWGLMLAPNRHEALKLCSELRGVTQGLDVSVVSILSPDTVVSFKPKTICFIDPTSLLAALTSGKLMHSLPRLRLVLCENLEALDATYELALSLLLHASQTFPVRFVGLSASLIDAGDLAAWIRVRSEALYNFRPTDRDQELVTVIQSFNIPHSAALFKTMAKPAHAAAHSGLADDSSCIVFVPSRALCRAVAGDLITQCAIESEMQGYLPHHLTAENLKPYLARVRDGSLIDLITRGIGIFHSGINKVDRTLLLELFAEHIVRVLVVPSDTCWHLPIRAGTVIVMGTQYVRLEDDATSRQIEDYTLQEIVRMQSYAYRHMCPGRFYLFCQAERQEMLTRFLNEGLPLESVLHTSALLERWYKEQKKTTVSSKQHAIEALDWTYMARRLSSNPLYYDASPEAPAERLSELIDHLDAQHSDS